MRGRRWSPRARCAARSCREGARFCPSCGASLAEEAPAPAGQERRLVTILFADLTGSTALGERLDPERLREVLDTYFDAMREEIEAEGGTVEKFIGDAVVAAFGVPTAHEDDPSRALRAALRMRRRLEDVNRSLEARFGVVLRVRTGVNTGEVLAALHPGPGGAMVAGDAVNVAARLEQAAEPGQIVVAERTARAARGFRYVELGLQDLRGKEHPVPAVALVEEAPDRPLRGVPGLIAPMVGRDRELAFLQTVFEGVVAEQRPNLVTIYGDPGVGKSRLVREFLGWAQAQQPAPDIALGRCLPYGEGVTYWPLAEILKSHAGVLDSDATEVVLGKIEVSCDDVLAADPSIDPAAACGAIAYTVGLEFPTASMRELEPRQVRDRMRTAWRVFFSSLSARSPLVVVIEDIHWADPALLELLEHLVDRVVGPVLFLCPSRPELTERRPGWGGGHRNVSSLAIEPLSAEHAGRLVNLLLSVQDLPDRIRSQILERAEGNPFFLEEIVRHLIDDRRIVRAGDRWRASSDIGDVEIPDTVQGVLAARIDLLDAAEKRALQRAAVVGRVFWPGPVGRLLNGDRDRLRDTLDRLVERELVRSQLTLVDRGRAGVHLQAHPHAGRGLRDAPPPRARTGARLGRRVDRVDGGRAASGVRRAPGASLRRGPPQRARERGRSGGARTSPPPGLRGVPRSGRGDATAVRHRRRAPSRGEGHRAREHAAGARPEPRAARHDRAHELPGRPLLGIPAGGGGHPAARRDG